MVVHMNLDFTYKKFYELCRSVENNYPTVTIAEYLSSNNMPDRFIIMRHDIDRKPKNSLHMARIEKDLGIVATYYFRMNSNVFLPEIIRDIENMGHDIGYHYETLGKSKGNYEEAIEIFKYELSEFRKICKIKTICMHGGPLSKYDNRDLWKVYEFKDFDILGEAYLSIGNDVNYFSDTGRSWNSKNNMRDFMLNKKENITVDTTDDMIDLINCNKVNRLYITSHPERWSSGKIEWCSNYAKDFAFNVGKKVLVSVR